jgi:hypothetical protein
VLIVFHLRRHLAFVALFVLVGLGLIACAGHHAQPTGGEDEQALAEDGSDSAAVESDTETMATTFVSASGATVGIASETELGGGELGLASLGDGAIAVYFPRGCLTVAPNAATRAVTYTFAGCTGPYGLLHISGVVAVSYSQPATNEIVIDYVGNGLQVNKALVNWTAHADITAPTALTRHMVWSAKLTGTTARNRAFQRTTRR